MWGFKFIVNTETHSSRMHRACLLNVYVVSHVWGWVSWYVLSMRVSTHPLRSHVWGGYPPPGHTHPRDQRYPSPIWTDTCENITFLQLRWRAVNMQMSKKCKLNNQCDQQRITLLKDLG